MRRENTDRPKKKKKRNPTKLKSEETIKHDEAEEKSSFVMRANGARAKDAVRRPTRVACAESHGLVSGFKSSGGGLVPAAFLR